VGGTETHKKLYKLERNGRNNWNSICVVWVIRL